MKTPSFLAAAALALAVALPAHAYPDRPITIVVPFSAGAGTDLTARLLARTMEKHAGRSVVVVNRAGAGGEIGMASVANAAPDGYTLSILNTPNVLTIPIERRAQFSLSSFDVVANIVDDPGTLSVRGDSPLRGVQDLVEAARKAPGTLTYGTAGVGSAGHISMLLLEQAAGIQLRHVPFKGTADVATALLGGHIDIGTANLARPWVSPRASSGASWARWRPPVHPWRRTCPPSPRPVIPSKAGRCAGWARRAARRRKRSRRCPRWWTRPSTIPTSARRPRGPSRTSATCRATTTRSC